MLRPIILAWLLALMGAHAAAADLGLQPTTIALDARHDRTTVQVHNHGQEPVTLQADGQAWLRRDGQDFESPTANLIVNPPLFTIPPGGTQLVRVGLRRPAEEEQETLYRLALRELPPAPGSSPSAISGQVRVLVALKLPVYVAPRTVRRTERWELIRSDDGVYAARVTNTGNAHLRLAAVRLQDAREATLAEHGPMAPLFPGETRQVPLRLAGPLPSGTLRLELSTSDEVRHVDVASASR